MNKQYNNKMLLINETFIIDHSIHDAWLDSFYKLYLKSLNEIPTVSDVILSKIKADYNPDGENYALQFKIKESDFEKLKNDFKLISNRNELEKLFKDKIASFMTILEIVES